MGVNLFQYKTNMYFPCFYGWIPFWIISSDVVDSRFAEQVVLLQFSWKVGLQIVVQTSFKPQESLSFFCGVIIMFN